MEENTRLDPLSREGGNAGAAGVLESAGCRMLRRFDLPAGCAESGYEHLRMDGLHVARQEVARRWAEGLRCGLMFMSLGANGVLRVGEVAQPAIGGVAAAAIGQRVWMLACDRQTVGMLAWTDDPDLAMECGISLSTGQALVHCIDSMGLSVAVLFPRRADGASAGWWSDRKVKRLLEIDAWSHSASALVN